MDLSQIDIEALFDDLEIDYKTSGKNVTSGWKEVNCPFCGDPSYHLGISPTNLFHCWRCGEKGNLVKYLKEVLHKNFYEVKDIMQNYVFEENIYKTIDKPKIFNYDNPRLNDNIKKYMPKAAFLYLQERGFEPNKISAKYQLKFFSNIGEFKFRIFIPVFENKNMVTFTTRDYSGISKIKYLHNKSVPIKSYVYNIDTIQDNIIIVEGVIDAWRMGDGSVSIFGIEYSKEQVLKISKLGANKIFVMFDDEEQAQMKATKLAQDLSPYCESIKTLYFHSDDSNAKDPAEWFKTNQEAEKIKEEIFKED